MRQYTRRPWRERFEEKIMIDDGCWKWRPANGNQYGKFVFERGDERLAHRLSYETYVEPIPKGLFVLHICDNKACVNPSHLFIGTQLTNMRDKVSKNRQPKGESHGASKLTESIIREIKSQDGIVSQNKMALKYGLSQSSIWRIINNKTWQHLTV